MPDDVKIAEALVHDSNLVLTGDDPSNLGRERDLSGVKQKLRLAETLLAGEADHDVRRAAKQALHPQTASPYGVD